MSAPAPGGTVAEGAGEGAGVAVGAAPHNAIRAAAAISVRRKSIMAKTSPRLRADPDAIADRQYDGVEIRVRQERPVEAPDRFRRFFIRVRLRLGDSMVPQEVVDDDEPGALQVRQRQP